jgi:hypothetical protein
MIQQREHVGRALAKRKEFRRIRRPAVTAKVRFDHTVAIGIVREHVSPVAPDAHASMQQQQRLAGPAVFVTESELVQLDFWHAGSLSLPGYLAASA